METLGKSAVMAKVHWAIEHSENLKGEWRLKNQAGKIVAIMVTISDEEVFVDKNGVRWVRE